MSKLMIEQTKDQMLELLRQGICEVNFMKKGGKGEPELVPRKMICTLSEKYLPPIDETKTSKRKSEDGPGMITCYDVENDGWRRFILDNMTEEVKLRPDLEL